MNSETNTVEGVIPNFSAGYDMLPAGIQINVRNAIMEECGWETTATFHNKRRGTHKIRPLEAKVIENHFLKYNIIPWTGEMIRS